MRSALAGSWIKERGIFVCSALVSAHGLKNEPVYLSVHLTVYRVANAGNKKGASLFHGLIRTNVSANRVPATKNLDGVDGWRVYFYSYAILFSIFRCFND